MLRSCACHPYNNISTSDTKLSAKELNQGCRNDFLHGGGGGGGGGGKISSETKSVNHAIKKV